MVFSTFFALCLLSPYIPFHSPVAMTAASLQPPDGRHWLGTNELGQDLLSRVMAAGRNSITVGLLAAAVATISGTLLGMISGYFGGWVDQVLSRVTDVVITVPLFPLLVIFSAYYSPSLHVMGLIMGCFGWCSCARIVRAQALSLSEWHFVHGIRAMGAGHVYILWRYILPFVLPLAAVKYILGMQGYLLLGVGLGFLGLGDARTLDWGTILNQAFTSGGLSLGCWWWFLAPVGAIIITSLSIALIGYSLEQRTDLPRSDRRPWSEA